MFVSVVPMWFISSDWIPNIQSGHICVHKQIFILYHRYIIKVQALRSGPALSFSGGPDQILHVWLWTGECRWTYFHIHPLTSKSVQGPLCYNSAGDLFMDSLLNWLGMIYVKKNLTIVNTSRNSTASLFQLRPQRHNYLSQNHPPKKGKQFLPQPTYWTVREQNQNNLFWLVNFCSFCSCEHFTVFDWQQCVKPLCNFGTPI